MSLRNSHRLEQSWFERSSELVAADLIGATMFLQTAPHRRIECRIVETEAYRPLNDAASHAARGLTKRNAPMFESAGRLYVYLIYGVHLCANIVCEQEGIGSAVLLRAAELLEGEQEVRTRRPHAAFNALMSGPGNMCRALGLTLADNSRSCVSDSLWFDKGDDRDTGLVQIHYGERVGITKDSHLLLRFFDANSPAVSAHRRAAPLLRSHDL